MSPVYQPEKVPPKLDRFCYLSHPAQRVMAALYKDYLQKKRDLLQCQVSKPSVNENYYQSIYESRFGAAPRERHDQVKDVSHTATEPSNSVYNTAYPDKEGTATDQRTRKPPNNNQNISATKKYNPGYQSQITKGRNINNQTTNPASSGDITSTAANEPACQSWMSSNASTYSDSPPIETQTYRILSQFQQEDFKDTYDVLISGKVGEKTYESEVSYGTNEVMCDVNIKDVDNGIEREVNFGNFDVLCSEKGALNASEGEVIPNTYFTSFDKDVINGVEIETCKTSGETVTCTGDNLNNDDTSLNVTEVRSSYWSDMNTNDEHIVNNLGDATNLDGLKFSDQSGESMCPGVDGSQSLFSQDDDTNDKSQGISVKLQKRQSTGCKTKKCARMQQLHGQGNYNLPVNIKHQKTSKTNAVIEKNNASDISNCKKNIVSNASWDVSKQSDFNVQPDLSVVYTDHHIDNGQPSTNNHMYDNYNQSYSGLEGTLGGKLQRLSVGGDGSISSKLQCLSDFDSLRKESEKNENRIKQNKTEEHEIEMESPFIERVKTFKTFVKGNNKENVSNEKEHVIEMESPLIKKPENLYPCFLTKSKSISSEDNGGSSIREKSKAESKRKMSNSFAVPFKKPRLPSISRPETPRKASLVDTGLMSNDELQELLSETLRMEEVVIVLIYKDASTQLRHTLFGQDTKQRKNASKGKVNYVEIDGLAVSSSCIKDKNVLTFPVKPREQQFEIVKEFWCRLLSGQTRKIGFHVKETLAAVMKIYKLNFEKVNTTWTVLDPTVGMWLLDPDKPITGFEAVLHALCLPEQVPSNNCLDVLYEDMMLLGIAMEKLTQKLKSKDMWNLFVCIETKLTTILAGMEMRMLHIATHTLIKFSEILKKKLTKLEQKAHQAAGHAFLLNSHAQLRQVLFEELRLDTKLPQKTKLAKTSVGRETSTSETVLTQLSPFHELPGIVLEYRQLQKLKSTYIDGILSSMKDDCLTTHWDQTGTATGRLTSFHPNIQAIPKLPVTISGYQDNYIADKDVNDEIEIYARDAFISRPGYSLVAADFQQIELRLLAHLANDPVLLKNFKDATNPDIFNVLTAQWLGKEVTDISSSEREQTKRVVYSVMYGAGKEKLAEYLRISPDNAKAIMSSFLTKFPSVGQFTKKCVEFCQRNGYTSSIFNRRRLFPNIKHPSSWLRAQAERQCVNFCIQGSAADICKAAMIQIENAIATREDLHAQLLVQIHDELLIEVADGDIQKMIEVLQDVMQSHQNLCGSMVSLQVPIPVSVSVGKKWGQMKPIETV